MIDFTSVNHKRGIMVLSSKDVRTVDRTLFDYTVASMCEQNYIDYIDHYIDGFLETGELDVDMVRTYLKFLRKHNDKCIKCVNECRRVFS